MADEVVVKMGVTSFPASGALSQGAVVTVDSSGEWAAAVAGDTVWFSLENDAATGELVSGRYELIMKVLVDGSDDMGGSAVAVGDDLYVDAGELTKDATGGSAVAKALEAVSSGATALIKVLVQK